MDKFSREKVVFAASWTVRYDQDGQEKMARCRAAMSRAAMSRIGRLGRTSTSWRRRIYEQNLQNGGGVGIKVGLTWS